MTDLLEISLIAMAQRPWGKQEIENKTRPENSERRYNIKCNNIHLNAPFTDIILLCHVD